MPIPVLVTVYPESDKVSRVEELVKWVTEEVRKNEPAVSDYRSYEGRGDEPEHTVYLSIVKFHSSCSSYNTTDTRLAPTVEPNQYSAIKQAFALGAS